ncbi:MAG: hypothetical protein U0930_02080 [Pirellulales bacterium]
MYIKKTPFIRYFECVLFGSLIFVAVGCGSGSKQAVLPTGQLTEEQKAAVKAADSRVDEEESQGNFNKRKR